MTVHVQALTNAGAETGDTTGWTGYGDSLFVSTAPNGVSPHSGTYCFGHNDGFTDTSGQHQTITVDVSLEAAIDANTAAVRVSGWYNNNGDSSALVVEFYDAGAVLIDSETTGRVLSSPINTWAEHELYVAIPVNTRSIRIKTDNHSSGVASRIRWDDFEMDISDNRDTDWFEQFATKALQIGMYAMGIYPAEQGRMLQTPFTVVAAAETSSGLFEATAHQIALYALVRPNGDRRELRAWTFKQDDHEFYGLQLGAEGTLVYDKLTNQWCQWKSPSYVYWRVEDVVDWEGINVACDTETGKIWQIDPDGRLDYETTPITSVVVGYLTHRFRTQAPCFMAELALSEGQPPNGFDDGTVGITLRTSTDDGFSYVSHGEVVGEGLTEDITVRWYGLGLMKSPGMLFEITDTGYARRIDGLDIEVVDG